jgi:MFS family permease
VRLHIDLGLLRDHDYRQLFNSTTVSQFGFQVTQLAMSLVAIDQLGASEFQAGVLVTVQFAAFLLIGLPAGAWVDRLRRRNVLIVSDVGRAILLASIPLAWWADALTLWQVYAVALAHGTLTVFFDVAYQSYLPHLVGRENLVEGNARIEAVRAVSQVAGPGLAGQLIRLLTAPVALLVDAVAMGASALFYARIRKREPRPARHSDARLLREIGQGLRYVLGHRLLRAIVMCTGTYNFFSNVAFAMMVFFLRRTLGLGAGEIGLVLSALGIGGVAGALVARRFANWLGQGRTIWVSVAFSSPFMLLIPLAENDWRVWVAAAAGSVSAGGGVIYNVTQVSFRQALTPDRLLGRMNATIRFLVWGTIPLGGLLGAFLGGWLGARTTVLIGALGGCLAFLPVFLSPLRSMRTLPTQPAEAEPAGDDEPYDGEPAGWRS